MRFEAVFFDAGETLLGPHPSFHELFARALQERGHLVTVEQVAAAFEAVAPTFSEVLDTLGIENWSISEEVSRRFWGRVYEIAFGHLGIDDSEGELRNALYSVFTTFDSYRLFDDAVPTIRSLRERGLTIGLISNFEGWLESMLVHMEAAPLFDVMVISGKEGIEKPDPKIFELALARASVAASESVYVGDHPRVDVQGSRSVGMFGVLIDRRRRYPDFDGARIETLSELPELLGQRPDQG